MVLLLLVGCVHTPPHPAFVGTWEKVYARFEEVRGVEYCVWESESLQAGGRMLWGLAPPETEQNWCRASGERAAWFDVVGEDGAFLSVRSTEAGCCPETRRTVCATWNLETGGRATLEEYDATLAAERWSEAQVKLAAEHPGGGWVIDRAAFLVSKGHVSFCATRGADLALVNVR